MSVFVADEQDELLDPSPLRDLATRVLNAEGVAPDAELAVIFVGVEEMTEYNERFMGRRGPTDVLAFPLEDLVPGRPPAVSEAVGPLNLGDVFICPAVVRRNAVDSGVAYEDELALIVVHGVLHVLGYDHSHDREAEAMEQREREILATVGRARP